MLPFSVFLSYSLFLSATPPPPPLTSFDKLNKSIPIHTARLVLSKSRHVSEASLLWAFLWLPVYAKIQYNVVCVYVQCLCHNDMSPYLSDCFMPTNSLLGVPSTALLPSITVAGLQQVKERSTLLQFPVVIITVLGQPSETKSITTTRGTHNVLQRRRTNDVTTCFLSNIIDQFCNTCDTKFYLIPYNHFHSMWQNVQ